MRIRIESGGTEQCRRDGRGKALGLWAVIQSADRRNNAQEQQIAEIVGHDDVEDPSGEDGKPYIGAPQVRKGTIQLAVKEEGDARRVGEDRPDEKQAG